MNVFNNADHFCQDRKISATEIEFVLHDFADSIRRIRPARPDRGRFVVDPSKVLNLHS